MKARDICTKVGSANLAFPDAGSRCVEVGKARCGLVYYKPAQSGDRLLVIFAMRR
jgi:hypothetical protein